MSISRRRFLQGTAAAAGVSVLNLTSMPAFAQLFGGCNSTGYRAIVGIDFAGGNDGFNMVIPQALGFDDYKRLRGGLAFEKGDGIKFSSEFHLHPAMAKLNELIKEKELLPVLNVGPMMAPAMEAVTNEKVMPGHLFSHNHQSTMVQSSARLKLAKNGFGALGEQTFEGVSRGFDNYSSLFDIGGGQVWTNSLGMQSNSVGSSAPGDIFLKTDNPEEIRRDRALFNAIQKPEYYQHKFEKHYAKIAEGAQETHERMSGIFATDTHGEFPDTHIGRQLQAVLQLIVNNDGNFGHQRQYFSCKLGGFDTHSNQLATHERLLGEYAEAIAAFHQALRLHNLADSVTSFTHSEFGRTLIPNGTGGTDHGWGSHSFVIGGAVDGSKTIGTYPILDEGSTLLLSRGRVVPTTSTDQVHASLLVWLGMDPNEIDNIFPALVEGGFEEKTLDLFKCA
ncbi:DUF1501 domain-containing protein [Vibrio sp. ZSDE26]|uniref:DUF1501 domain-containing protein n=1 Tax=Vibrio amylolyticus TaxID=2847292 RepID=A0A9X1XHY7_9VIBR|nr:DUF1501 domain-containing protein [Vibrio amylolyticus]MCK6263517.1 DUF1501 domain-containing protein [Vibrio amylolyticus]